MKYLSGKDYPWLCSKCRAEIDSAIRVISFLADASQKQREVIKNDRLSKSL